MNGLELPPQVPVDSALVFGSGVPPAVLRTFVRLYTMAWKYDFEHTERLRTDELSTLLGLSQRPMYYHLARLRELGVLDWVSDGRYGYVFRFPKSQGALLRDEGLHAGAAAGAWVPGPGVSHPHLASGQRAVAAGCERVDGPCAAGSQRDQVSAAGSQLSRGAGRAGSREDLAEGWRPAMSGRERVDGPRSAGSQRDRASAVETQPSCGSGRAGSMWDAAAGLLPPAASRERRRSRLTASGRAVAGAPRAAAAGQDRAYGFSPARRARSSGARNGGGGTGAPGAWIEGGGPVVTDLLSEAPMVEMSSWESGAQAVVAEAGSRGAGNNGLAVGVSRTAAEVGRGDCGVRTWDGDAGGGRAGASEPAVSGRKREPVAADISSRSYGARNPAAESSSSSAGNSRSAAVISSSAAVISSSVAGNSRPAAESSSSAAESSSSAAENSSPVAGISSPAAVPSGPVAVISSSAAEISTPAANNNSCEPVVVDVLDPGRRTNQQQQHRKQPGAAGAENSSWVAGGRGFEAGAAEISRPAASGRRVGSRADPGRWPELVAVLIAAGVWADRAVGLAAGLDVDGVLDALGWVAAVRVERRVRNPGAVLASHLQAGRPAPVAWRPLGVCAACGVVVGRCGCGAGVPGVPAAYYAAAIEPVRVWGRDAWGVCESCGRVACAGHEPVGEAAVGAEVGAVVAAPRSEEVSNGGDGKANQVERRIRRAWLGVAEYVRLRCGVEVKLVEVGDYQVRVTFVGDARRTILNVAQMTLNGEMRDYVEMIDGGPG